MPTDYSQWTWGEEVEAACRRVIENALIEDLGERGDVTTRALVGNDESATCRVVARRSGVLAGRDVIAVVLATVAEYAACRSIGLTAGNVEVKTCFDDGDRFSESETIATLRGPTSQILTAERTVLNLLGRLCGVATLTRRYVDAVSDTPAAIYDTRKTTPGWRALEKYAVSCGGGRNHRSGLDDAVLIKDNHLAAWSEDTDSTTAHRTPADAVVAARRWLERELGANGPETVVEIEVDTIEQLRNVLSAEPDIVLLDNMPPVTLRQAVELRNRLAPGVVLEASGGVTLATVAEIAGTGVDRISVGALTHSATSLDLGLDWSSDPSHR